MVGRLYQTQLLPVCSFALTMIDNIKSGRAISLLQEGVACTQILHRVKSNCMTSGHDQYSVLFFITQPQVLSVNLVSGVKYKFVLVKMAASIMMWESRGPVHKFLIREALSERIGKLFKIVHSKKHLNGRICIHALLFLVERLSILNHI